ncbi:MAG: hypothetical protein JWM06_2737 [Actinomycetia bacterium]|nr:hypothetical protein [Actinomycetes bacterium]
MGKMPLRRVGDYVRFAPATFVYLTLLGITTGVLVSSDAQEAARLLLERSTNLAHLSRDPARVLLASAFWLSSPSQLPVWVALFVLVLAHVEHRVGSRRMVAVFAIGHVGATLLVAGGLWIALRAHAVAASVVDAEDVGVSYGFLAVASASTCLLGRPLRAPWLGGLLVYALSDMLTPVSFTDFGHLAAVLIGIACTPLVRRAAVTRAMRPAKSQARRGELVKRRQPALREVQPSSSSARAQTSSGARM